MCLSRHDNAPDHPPTPSRTSFYASFSLTFHKFLFLTRYVLPAWRLLLRLVDLLTVIVVPIAFTSV